MLRYERRLVAQQILTTVRGTQYLEFRVKTSDDERYLPGKFLRMADLHDLGKSGVTIELKPLQIQE